MLFFPDELSFLTVHASQGGGLALRMGSAQRREQLLRSSERCGQRQVGVTRIEARRGGRMNRGLRNFSEQSDIMVKSWRQPGPIGEKSPKIGADTGRKTRIMYIMENFKFPGLSRACCNAGVQFYVAQASQGIIYLSEAGIFSILATKALTVSARPASWRQCWAGLPEWRRGVAWNSAAARPGSSPP